MEGALSIPQNSIEEEFSLLVVVGSFITLEGFIVFAVPNWLKDSYIC
jgi:hypothetical protein